MDTDLLEMSIAVERCVLFMMYLLWLVREIQRAGVGVRMMSLFEVRAGCPG